MSGGERRAREYWCPRCGAAPGAACRSEDAGEWADHADRKALATGRPIASGSPRGLDRAALIPQVALERRLPRWLVRTVACPACGAQPGQLCARRNGAPRQSNHAGRITVAWHAGDRRVGAV
jgi:hypothetical protein